MIYLKISIITPNYNGYEYLEETINSILSQNYPNLEYIIIDGGSTDKSVEIIKKYENKLSYWISESDNGLYDALQKGFSKTTGDIMGWLNSDDLLHPKSLFTINEIFQLSEVKWLQGKPSTIDEKGRTIGVSDIYRWSKINFWMGNYKWIQQESTFWHKDLWEKAGSYIDTELKLAGDFELWNRFFKYEKLYVTNALIGGFRFRSKNQLSLDYIDDYNQEAENILNNNEYCRETILKIKRIKKYEKYLTLLRKTRFFNIFALKNRITNRIIKLQDFPPSINFNRNKQKFYI